MKRMKVIACDVLNREVSLLSSQSPVRLDTVFVRQGLHDTPDLMRKLLQEEIDKANQGTPPGPGGEVGAYDAILLLYGLCGNGTVGLVSRRVPLVMPRAHDCFTMILGSKEKYGAFREKYQDVYAYSCGWIERAGEMPSPELDAKHLAEYTELYGEENAEFLVEQLQGWVHSYTGAALITWPELPFKEVYEHTVQKTCDHLNWQLHREAGDSSLLRRLLFGEFLPEETQIFAPGQAVAPSHDRWIVKPEDAR